MALGTDTSSSGGAIDIGSGIAGDDMWAAMSGISAASPLVGGTPGVAGYGVTGFANVATSPSPTAALAAGTARRHWSGAFDLKNNPLSWLLLVCLVLWAGYKLEHKRG